MFKILITFLLFCTTAYATHGRPNHYDLYTEMVPAYCGTVAEIDRYITDNKLKPTDTSFGREQSLPDGEFVFLLTQYEDIIGKQFLVTIDWPDSGDTRCILFHTFDLKSLNTFLSS